MMPFTPVGSLGDVIAVSLLARDLARALDDTRGSATEYQQVIQELWAFDQALHEVEHLSANCGQAVRANALCQTTTGMALQCRGSIDAFLTVIKRYQASLRKGGSGNVLRDTYWKVHWKVSQKDELQKFRAIISGQVSMLNMLLATTAM